MLEYLATHLEVTKHLARLAWRPLSFTFALGARVKSKGIRQGWWGRKEDYLKEPPSLWRSALTSPYFSLTTSLSPLFSSPENKGSTLLMVFLAAVLIIILNKSEGRAFTELNSKQCLWFNF